MRLEQAARAVLALGGQAAVLGADHLDSALAQRREVGLGGSVLVHVVVHRRRHQHGTAGGERAGAEHVLRQPRRELCNRVGRGRRDQVHLRALHELQMARRFVIRQLLSG